jgi:hypothetical protein
LDLTIVSFASSQSSPLPLIFLINQNLDGSFAQVIQKYSLWKFRVQELGWCLSQGGPIHNRQEFGSDCIDLGLFQFDFRMLSLNIRHIDAGYSFLICPSQHSRVRGVFSVAVILGMVFSIVSDVFPHPSLLPTAPISRREGILRGGPFSIQVSYFFSLPLVSFSVVLRRVPCLLVQSLRCLQTIYPHLKKQRMAFSITYTWSSCCDKSAGLPATCIILGTHVYILVPRVWENNGHHWQGSL